MLKNLTENSSVLMENISEFVPGIFLHSLGSILGIVGSIVIISAIIVTKELRNSTNMIIGNIAVADFILSSIVDTVAIVGILLYIKNIKLYFQILYT